MKSVEEFNLEQQGKDESHSSETYTNSLPTFIIAGAHKAGTTSLYSYLSQHPEIYMSPIKEPHFFIMNFLPPRRPNNPDTDPVHSLPEYMGLFENTNKRVRGEASTGYYCNRAAIEWINKVIPSVKIIVLLRNPIDRAVSDFFYQKSIGAENRAFEQAMIEALKLLGYSDIDEPAEPENVKVNFFTSKNRYLYLGKYGEFIQNIQLWFPKTQVFIGDYEELNYNQESLVKKMCNFLEVDDVFSYDSERQNVSARGDFKIEPSLQIKLMRFFEEDIRNLQSLVDFDVLKWLKI